ncbi:2-isopropylmalate synthase [Peptococcaceae bacterium]|nr:2-isopropylmalate synthase [Peptococcaceae bacterium]
MGNRVYLFDTTLRDGEQSPGVNLNADEKVQIANQLAKLGIDIIEAGFPVTSPGDFEAVKAVAKKVKGAAVAALARANFNDIDTAWEAIKDAEQPRIHTFIATSDIHLKYKLKKNREQVLDMAVAAVKYACKYTSDVEFSAEDASRSDIDYLCKVIEAVIDVGAKVVNIPDTVGYTTPEEFYELISAIMKKVNVGNAIISVHCHDDLGLAVANSLAAVSAGARQVEGTINGIGERAGNAALEEIIMAIHTRRDRYKVVTSVNTKEIYRTSRLISSLTGMPVQHNKAIVGKNAFAHESGIHQDGVLKERATYEIMNPEMVGIPQSSLVLGKHSGRHAFRERLAELGYNLTDEELDKAFKRFKELTSKKKEISDSDIEAIVTEETIKIDNKYVLDYIHISSGNTIVPTATVVITVDGEKKKAASWGDGPVDAIYNAIDKITNLRLILEEYSINAVTAGKDALGEVVVKLRKADNGEVYTGRGVSTDVIEASAKAYINAANKIAINQNLNKG